jgi:predicted nucleic acid-binding protein
MSETEAFLDTKVLLHMLSADESKANRAEALVEAGGVISVQVLNEFASVASRKLGMAWGEIREVLDTLCALCRVEPLDLETHALGLSFAERYRFSVYDAMILASARRANCTILYSEDLQHGQVIDDGLKVINPFTTA